MINRHNYEEFFLLYVDNELSVAERKAVETFVEENPDLEEELVMMMQSVLRPDKHVVFGNKESLLKNKPNGLVNQSNYEEYFVLYGDNELTNEEKDLVEQFVYKHPQFQAEFELIQQARLLPDHATIYPDKNELYRTEKDERVIPFAWWRIAAAAILVLFLGGTVWFMMNNDTTGNTDGGIVKNNAADTSVKAPLVQPKANNESQLAVKEDKKEEKKVIEDKAPVVNLKDNLATNNTKKEKNIKKKSNIEDNKIVTQESPEKNFAHKEDLKEERQATAGSIKIGIEKTEGKVGISESVVANKDPNAAMKQSPKEVIYIDEYTSDEDIKLASASISKKPVRGLIRKVKGLFEGNSDAADANDPAPTNKKGIRIAAFEIGLK